MRLRFAFLFGCVTFVACASILGLDEPSFFGASAGDGGKDGDATTANDACPGCPPLGPEKLASDLGKVFDLAIDDKAVYFTSFDRWLLGRVDKDGSNRYDLLPEGGVQEPTGLVVQGDHVYWTAYGAGDFADFRNGVRRIKKDGGAAQSFDKCNTGWDLAVDGRYVFAVTGACGGPARVRRFTKDDPDAGFVESYVDPDGGAEYAYATYGWASADEGAFYFSSAFNIRSLDKNFASATVPNLLATSPQGPSGNYQAIRVDDRIYALLKDSIISYDKSGATKPIILVDGLDAGGGRSSIALDDKSVYFTQASAGIVGRVPRSGAKSVDVLAKGQALPSGIAVDATWVYWANAGDGTVWRTPK